MSTRRLERKDIGQWGKAKERWEGWGREGGSWVHQAECGGNFSVVCALELSCGF